MKPLYLEKLTVQEMREKARILHDLLESCSICPNKCDINRLKYELGRCTSDSEIQVASIGKHMSEEPPISGYHGSGTIFFTNCNMNCLYCQNAPISSGKVGRRISPIFLASEMLRLQFDGCHNINFVSPSHYIPQIVEAVSIAMDKGLEIPLVFNSGGYDTIEVLEQLEGVFDIYMPDIKYSSNQIGKDLSGVERYWDIVRVAVKEMHRQVGDLKIGTTDTAKRGLLIRHLVLPNKLAGSEKVIDFVAKEISSDTYLNIMDQFFPYHSAKYHEELGRKITVDEYEEVIKYAYSKGLRRGFGLTN